MWTHRMLPTAAVLLLLSLVAYARYYQRPYANAATILPAHGESEVLKYAGEFAGALGMATHSSLGVSLEEPHFYLDDLAGDSPDGRYTLLHHDLVDAYHKIQVRRNSNNQAETVLVLQESDPGSGRSHGVHWASDSQAIFIYGSGTPAGHPHTRPLSLVYLVKRQKLYAVDLTDELKVLHQRQD